MPASARRKPACNPDTLDRLRVRSNYERMTGYTPFFIAWLADLPRLCPGASCWALVMTVATESLGRPRDKGEPMPEWTLDLEKDFLAMVCRTDRRTVDRDLSYLESSGMAEVRHTIQGKVAVRLLFRDWPNLPDYGPPDRPEVRAEPSDPKETVELVKTPRHVKAGEYSEPVKVSCPVSSFRFQAGGSVDLAFTAVVKRGEFLVSTCEVLAQGETKAKHPNVSNELTSKVRHTGLTFPAAEGEQTAKDEVKAKHPRADELERLFDPILLRSCGRSLSADTVAFNQALEALGDLPHEFLVKFVVQRAERHISSPKVCASILKEARANWIKAGSLEKPLAAMTNSERIAHLRNLEQAQKIPPQAEQSERWQKRSGSFR